MELIDKIKDFKNQKVLVVGDIMIDNYIEGEVSRICPEAPVPIMDVMDTSTYLGGAGNVAVYLSELGAKVYLFGQIGEDTLGHETLKGECHKYNIDFIGECPEGYNSTTKNRAVNKNGQIIFRWDQEQYNELYDFNEEELKDILNKVDVVVISDYGKGIVTPEISKFIIQNHDKVIVDPKHGPWDHFYGAYVIKPNIKEFYEVMGIDASSERIIVPTRTKESINTNFVVTLGEHGIRIFPSLHTDVINVPTDAKDVIDVTGAGDMVSAVLALSTAAGMNLVQSAKVANVAAGIKVSQHGTGSVSLEELIEEFIDQDAENRIYNLVNDKHALNKLTRNKKVVFTNGCFDLLHDGHIQLLKKAKEEGDVLVVGLNSDDSIKRIKGENRPIQNEQVRSMVLASIKYVDAVVVFDEDTPLELIKKIKPDVLVKGSDYAVSEIIGANEVLESGGRIATVDLIEGSSTTAICEKIKKTDSINYVSDMLRNFKTNNKRISNKKI